MNEDALAELRHDLRTPIGLVLGYGEMVEEELTDAGRPDLAADIGKIRAAGQRLLQMVNDRLSAEALGADTPAPHTLAASSEAAFAPPSASSIPTGPVPLPAGFSRQNEPNDQNGLMLIVDDNEDNRAVLARRLEKQGHRSVTASSGPEALAALAEQPFDLVLLDIMMPEMDGYEVLSRIKSDPQTYHLPVIMISARDEIESVVRCIESGAADYLPKPFNPTLLRARVGASLRDKRAHDREQRHTAELAESYRKLQQLERLRDDLTYMIVHDLRTPLTSLLSGLQTVPLVGEMNSVQDEMLAIAVDGGETLLSMINDLLDVEKMEQESVPLSKALLSADTLIERACVQVTLLAASNHLSLVQDVSPGLPEFEGDEDKLKRTLVNLIGNAIKFTPSGGTVTVQGILSENTLLFSVRDTGEGIPPEAFERIFEKFGQVENRQAGRKMSTGLGLTFCKLAVEAHGGRIWVQSAPDRGSIFFFTVPL